MIIVPERGAGHNAQVSFLNETKSSGQREIGIFSTSTSMDSVSILGGRPDLGKAVIVYIHLGPVFRSTWNRQEKNLQKNWIFWDIFMTTEAEGLFSLWPFWFFMEAKPKTSNTFQKWWNKEVCGLTIQIHVCLSGVCISSWQPTNDKPPADTEDRGPRATSLHFISIPSSKDPELCRPGQVIMEGKWK